MKKWLVDLMCAGAERGDIPDGIDFEAVATMLMIIADGVWWRRALDPSFDAKAQLPLFMDITRNLLRARPKAMPAKEGSR